MIRAVSLAQILALLVSANPLPAPDKYGIADPTTAPTEEGANPPSQSSYPPPPASPQTGRNSSEPQPQARQITVTPRSLHAHLLRRDGDDVGVFDGSMVSLVKDEQKGVQNKYAKAVKYLHEVRPGQVDLGFNRTMTQQSTNSSTAEASGSSTTSLLSSTTGVAAEDITSSTVSSTNADQPTSTSLALCQSTGLLGSKLDTLDARGASGLVDLTDWISGGMDVLYYGGIQVGSQAQDLTVDFDTGSADLWLPVECEDCTGDHFDAKHSSTYKNTGDDFEIEYGTGSVSGTLAQDSVSMAGAAVNGQYFGAVDQESEDFDGNPNAGVMGMAFSSISSSGKPTYFENLISSKSIPSQMFGFHLTRRQESGSTLCIGCLDSSKFTGDIQWAPVISKTYWSVTMSGMAAMGKGNALDKSLVAAIDTGTTLIYVPHAIASDFYAQIPGASEASQFGPGFYQFPCNSPLQVTLNFASKSFKMATRDFNLGRTGSGSSLCVGGVLGMGSDFPSYLAIIGDEFLKSWYSIYDYGNGARVGFAASINN